MKSTVKKTALGDGRWRLVAILTEDPVDPTADIDNRAIFFMRSLIEDAWPVGLLQPGLEPWRKATIFYDGKAWCARFEPEQQ